MGFIFNRRESFYGILFYILSFLCFSILFTVPAQSASDKPLFKVAFNNPGYRDKGFWKQVNDAMQAAADDFNIELHTWYGDRDAQKMRSNAAEIYQSDIDFDYLILVNEHQQGTGFLRKSEEKKIKTLYLLNTVTEAQQDLVGRPGERFKSWIGSLTPDNSRAGYEMAASLGEYASSHNWPLPLPILFISGDNKTPASLFRNQGLFDAIKEGVNIQIVESAHALWSREKAHFIATNFMKRAPKPPFGVWAANDNIAHGAIDAFQEHGLQPGKDFIVAGLNWSAWGVAAVRQGEMTMTHGGHFFGGAWAMVALYDDFRGYPITAPDKHIRFRMTALTNKNLSEYVSKFGTQDWQKIDFRHFSRALNPSLTDYDFSLSNILKATAP